ncbi:TIGR04283 family arsenosugar biosynthesis glycosyltransferase [Bizionia sediminis]|uniref:TIGR04283 family arsenosugar biosynthesis glycosyltransferase n=1 Tax=Bizionia sediminis TaxID=1737064 RepID=A0ABW5KRU2_9FLAO
MANKLSIIIPMLNEADNIASVLEHVITNCQPNNIANILVVDGGSTDGSQAIVKSYFQYGVKLLTSEKGRAKQMNVGAAHATGSVLYFLHADSFPPANFDALILKEVQKGHLAGCFRMQFISNHWWLKLAGWFTQFSWRACRGGDQSQFITKTLFNDLGGYDTNYIIYEDNILINQLYARKQFTVIPKKIKTSARLYDKHGVWNLQYHFWMIYIKKWLGATPKQLHQYYKKHIS